MSSGAGNLIGGGFPRGRGDGHSQEDRRKRQMIKTLNVSLNKYTETTDQKERLSEIIADYPESIRMNMPTMAGAVVIIIRLDNYRKRTGAIGIDPVNYKFIDKDDVIVSVLPPDVKPENANTVRIKVHADLIRYTIFLINKVFFRNL